MPEVNPVTNPMGALQALADPMTRMMTEGYDRNRAQLDTLKEQARRAPETDAAERWAAMAQAASKVPPVVGGFGALLASIGGAYGQALSAQDDRNFARQAKIAELMDKGAMPFGSGATTAMLQAALNPIMNIGGVGVNRQSGQMIVPKALEGEYSKLFTKFYDQAVEQKMPNPEQWAQSQARSTIEQHILANPSIAGSTYGQRPGQAPLPSQGGAPQAAPMEPGAVAPQVDLPVKDIAPWIARLKQDEAEAVRAGDYARATEVKKARAALEAAQPTEAPSPLQYRDIPKAKGAEKTAEKSAEIYATQFEDNVVKPAMAMANTGKIMQDFNNLGRMQSALKSGKLKEFLGGEGGKWVLTFTDPGSDLAKGVANAQEAEKLTAGMVNQILLMAKGVQTEGDAQRARSQVTQIGISDDANRYVEAYISETARQLQSREQLGRAHKKVEGTYEGFDDAWRTSPIMTKAIGSVKKVGNTWVGLTQYVEKFKAKNPSASDMDAITSWNSIRN